MADVFISYASEDRERVRTLAGALEARGFSIWWDRKIKPGQTFDQVIEDQLDTAKSVVVVWSKSSISSEWVKNEASAAATRGVLVPAMIDNVKLPLEFRRKQTADLIKWGGDPLHDGFQAVCDAIGTKPNIGHQALHMPTKASELSLWWNHRWTLAAITAIAVALGFGAFFRLTVAPQNDGGVTAAVAKIQAQEVIVRVEVDNSLPNQNAAACSKSQFVGKDVLVLTPDRHRMISVYVDRKVPCFSVTPPGGSPVRAPNEVIRINERDASNLFGVLPTGESSAAIAAVAVKAKDR